MVWVNHSAASSLPLIPLQRFFLAGIYATRIYLPFSTLAQSMRRFTRRLRGKQVPHEQRTRLPKSGWNAYAKSTLAGLVETGKKNGNVRVSEVGVLAHFAADCPRGSMIFEIGTFDGRTSLNMALNACMECEIHTLDLPQDTKPAMALAPGEGHMVDKPVSGARIGAYRDV